MPSVSVVICSRGRPGLLLDAVRSVLSMDRLPSELVVVDQSDEHQPELAAGLPDTPVDVRYLWAPDRGLSRARNVGVDAARGDVIAFLDDDMLVDPRWLGRLVDRLADRGDRYVLSGKVTPGVPEVPGAWAPSTIVDDQARSYAGRLDADVLYAGNMALYRSVFDEIGRFDERLGAGTTLPSAEDNDFCYRLLRAGFVIEYRPEMEAVHRAWRRENALVLLKHDYGRGQGGFYAKYAARGDRYMVRRFALDVTRHLRRAVRRLLRARLNEARSDIAYTRGLFVGAYTWVRRT
jgi:glycosyltransferase involved in cell wall biosynthesis